MIKKKSDGWHVYSTDGEKHLGGPYESEKKAVERENQAKMFKHMKSSRVNVLSVINSSKIKRLGNRITVSGMVPIVDNVVMNGGLYPADEIANSFSSIADKPAPAGHPVDAEGNYIPAAAPEAMLNHYIGAWCRNVRYADGRVSCDVEINADQAMAMPRGKELIERLDKAANGEEVEPIHVSTGLLLNKEKASGEAGGKKYSWIARNMEFDHVAILLDQQGAATPSDGVGMFVNAQGEKIEVENAVMNIDAVAADKRGKLTRWVNAIAGGMSFSQIVEKLQDAVEDEFGEGLWICEVYADSVVFTDGEHHYRSAYKIDGDKVVLQNPPAKVDRVVTYEDKDEMSDEAQKLAEQAMNAAQKSGEELGKVAKLVADLAGQVAALNESVKAVTAGKEAEVNAKREAIKAHYKLDDLAVNAMGEAAVNAMHSQIKSAAPIGSAGTFAGNQWDGYDFNKLEG